MTSGNANASNRKQDASLYQKGLDVGDPVRGTKVGALRIGFTGTQLGMTEAQRAALKAVLTERDATVLHHGDCIGADAQAHEIAVSMSCEIVIHPPIVEAKRAWKQAARTLRPTSYLARNKDIVRDTAMLVATPGEDTEQIRSGTWLTVRFARRRGRPVWVILPNGKILREWDLALSPSR
jgi:hypothetical protein